MRSVLTFVLALVMQVSLARAQSLHKVGVHMDLPANHPGSTWGDNIERDQVDLTDQGEPLAEFDVNGRGYRYPNKSRRTISGFRLKVRDPDRHRFDPVACDGGNLFEYVEVLDDGREVIFGRGILDREEEAYIYMPNRDDPQGRRIYYLGEALTTDPAPQPVAGKLNEEETAWQHLRKVCPSQYRHPDAYAFDRSRRHLLLFQGGVCHLFDSEKAALAEVLPEGRFDGLRVNRVTFERGDGKAGTFRLWHNERRLASVSVNEPRVVKDYTTEQEGEGETDP
jgi:hypothetical protein